MPLFYFKVWLFHHLFPVLVLALYIHAIPKMHRAYQYVTQFSSMLDFEYERDLRQLVRVHVEHEHFTEVWCQSVMHGLCYFTAQPSSTEGDLEFNKGI